MGVLSYAERERILQLPWSLINEGLLEIQQVTIEQLEEVFKWEVGDYIVVETDMNLTGMDLCKLVHVFTNGIHVMLELETRQGYGMYAYVSQCMRISKHDAIKKRLLMVW